MPVKKRWTAYTRANMEKISKELCGMYEIADKNDKIIYIGGSRSRGVGIRGRLINHLINKKFPSAKSFRYEAEEFLGFDDGIDMERKHSQKFIAKYKAKPAQLKRTPKKVKGPFEL